MAVDLTRTIEILFEGTNRTGTAITSVGKDLDELNYRIGSVAKPLADLSGTVVKLDAVLAGFAAGGVAYAFAESSKLQTAFTELAKVAGDNVDVLDGAKAAAKALSNQYGEASAEILSATANYVQAGFTVDQAMQLTRTGMDLVIAGGVDAAKSSEILIASLKGFKAPAEDAGRLLDILNEVSNKYATDIEQLGTGMAGISPIAKTMNFTMEETAGILTPVIEVFRSGDEAATALKTGLLRLIDDSEPVKNALASIGVSQRDANGDLRSGKDILYDVGRAFQTLDQDQKLFVTQQLVGINQSARMVEVFDGLAKSTEITAVAMGAAGSAAKEVAVRLQDPEVAVNRLVESFKNLSSSIGDEFQAAGITALNGVTDIFGAIEKAVAGGAFDPLLDALNDFLTGIGENLTTIAKNLPQALAGVDFSGFIHSIEAIKSTLGGVFDGIDFGKPDSLQKAIQKVVDTFTSLVDFSNGMAQVFVNVFNHISGLIDGINSFSSETKTAAGNITGIGAVISAITGPIGALTTAFTGLGHVLTVLSAGQLAGLVKSLVGSGGLTSALAVVQAHPLIAAGAAGVAMGTVWRKMVPEVDQAAQSVLKFVDKYTGLFGVEKEHQRVQAEGVAVQQRFTEVIQARAAAAENAAGKDQAYFKSMADGADQATDATAELTEALRKTGALVEERKTVDIDTSQAVENLQKLEYFRESTGKWETITVPVDTSQVAAAKKEIDSVPAVKRLEIETDLNIERIKAGAATAQAAMKFRAEVDIREIEASTERIKVLSNNITAMFQDTGKTISNLIGSWGSEDSLQKKWAIQDALSDERDRRDRTLSMQEELNTAQVKYMNEKAAAIKRGDALIKVNGDGLAPHLKAIMYSLFDAIHIEVTQEGLDQLLLGGTTP